MAKQNKAPYAIKAGRGVRAKVWTNSGKNGDWFNVEITRCYKNDEGELQDSKSYSRDDLLHMAYAARQAFEYILDQQNGQEEGDE